MHPHSRLNRRKFWLLGAVAVALALCALVVAQDHGGGDYLTPKLRQDVDRLKRDVEKQPTNATNMVERGLILWDWVNAYSLTGGPVPVNATQVLAPVFQLKDGSGADAGRPAAVRALAGTIDQLVYEFRIKDEHPRAIPTLRLDRAGPFDASSWQTIQVTLTVGEMPMPPGSTMVMAHMLMSDGSTAQVDNPAGDAYVSIRSSNAGVRFGKTKVPWTGMHGGFRGTADLASWRVESGTLQPGDTVTLTFGDTAGGGRGFQMQSFSNDKFLLPIYLNFKKDGPYLTPVWPPINVQGKTVAAVKGFAPSIVKPGERFELAVRSEDDRWNRATGSIPAYEVSLDGQAVRSIPAGTEGLAVLKDVAIDKPGTYRFAIRSADGKICGESNPIWVEADPKFRVYWGETHAHSGFSEGMGSIDGFYKWGRDDARLDFLGLSEHDIWTDAGKWRTMQDAVRRYTDPGRYIAYLAYEWTAQRPMGGHHNVFFRRPDQNRAPVQIAYTLSRLYQMLRAGNKTDDVLIIPHAHQAGDWRRNDPDMERVVEIASMHGTFEWFGNYYLRNGHQVGFVAAADDHRTRPGYSGTMRGGSLEQFGGLVAVKTQKKDVNEIFDALRDRYTYAVTAAQRILLDVDLNGERVGRRIPYSADRRIHARFSGTAPLDRVDVIKNGEVVFSRRLAAAPLTSRVRAQIGFRSSSEPFIRDNPRGYRRWRGTIEVEGARVLAVEPYFDNRFVEYARLDSPNKISFLTDTRGGIDALMLDLDGATPSTKITIDVEPSVEHDGSPPTLRPLARIPAAKLAFPFSELKEGLIVRESAVDRHIDTVTLQLADAQAPRDGTIDYQDRTKPDQGDYYYVRVTQLNGAHAWSSPVWVGGESTR
jgi:hypothetical protein